jgi:hypothetical protein
MDHTYPGGYFDGALYRVHMKSGAPPFSGPKATTFKAFMDAPNTTGETLTVGPISTGVTDGVIYSFGVVATDCVYENSTDPLYQNNYSGWKTISSIAPGRIVRDEMCPDPVLPIDIQCTKDEPREREILTGVDLDNSAGNGTGQATPSSTLTHDTITLFFENTSAATMTIQGLGELSWINSDAILKEVTIGGGRSGVGSITTTITTLPTVLIPSGVDPYTRTLSGVDLTDVTITAKTRYVPIIFRFEDSSGGPVDMRADQLRITLDINNDSTGTASCVSYLTISEDIGGIPVPTGPTITLTQQDHPNPDFPTPGFAVPGITGLNVVESGVEGPVIVDARVDVTVSTIVTSNTTDALGNPIDISSVKLFFKATSNSTTVAPTSGFTEVTMTDDIGNPCSGFTSGSCNGTITAQDGQRVWYYILAEDVQGNFDRDPEIDNGAYVYDQKTFDVCDVTPNPPTNLSIVSVTGPDINNLFDIGLSWTEPATYTNGVAIDAGDTLTYSVFRNGSSTALAASCSSGTCTVTDTGLLAGVYSYNVKASNSCATPGPNVSDFSDTTATCAGVSGQATIDVNPTSIFQGESYTVTIVDCLAIVSPNDLTTEVINVTSGFTGFTNTSAVAGGTFNPTVNETGPATATFITTIETTGDVAESGKLLVAETDTITAFYAFAIPSSKTVSVVPDPCDSTPKVPVNLCSGPNAGACNTSGNNIHIEWSAVTQNTDDSAIIDLAGYNVFMKVVKDSDSSVVKDFGTTPDAIVGPGTTSADLRADFGNLAQHTYFFRVTAFDTCATPNESGFSSVVNEPF